MSDFSASDVDLRKATVSDDGFAEATGGPCFEALTKPQDGSESHPTLAVLLGPLQSQ
jgi:hypothetical protein